MSICDIFIIIIRIIDAIRPLCYNLVYESARHRAKPSWINKTLSPCAWHCERTIYRRKLNNDDCFRD